MIHPHTAIRFIDDAVGVGVVATQPIPRGTITWIRDALDIALTAEQIAHMHPWQQELMDRYTFRDRHGAFILCWDHCKYMNHSFRPTCIASPLNFDIAVVDIAPGEQLTNDYGFLNITEPFTPVDEGAGRTTVHPDDILRHANEWDALVAQAVGHLLQVTQPLQPFVPDEVWAELEQNALGRRPVRSIRELYCG
ncbi:MAG: SET domain-containing protein [Saprospiraceae bacterium]|nr:SET domain-containing protein [Saprospiraceae bacterium]